MSFVCHKTIRGKKYAYEIQSYWDKELKKVRKKNKYLGVVTDDGTICKKRSQGKLKQAQDVQQLDFGDTFLLHEVFKKSTLNSILNKTLEKYNTEIPSLIFYRIIMQSAMYNAQDWLQGNIASLLFEGADLSSQNISRILKYLGDEKTQRFFFSEYLSSCGGSEKAVIIDATSLPSQSHTEFNAWGYADGHIEKQFRLLCVLDQETKRPLFYRYLPGNLSDVVTLQHTITELSKMGVKSSFVLLDAGYFSEENIKDLYNKNINFLTRLPCSRRIYKDLIEKDAHDLENSKYATKCGSRGLFVKRVAIDVFGNPGYAFLVLDPLRKGKEVSSSVLEYLEDPSSQSGGSLSGCGVMILISSMALNPTTVVSHYYTRQAVEQVFGFCKDDLQILPLRRHSDETMRGYLFLQFIALVLFIELRNALQSQYTVEQAMLIARNLKCKVFDREILVAELTSKQKQIFELCHVLVPKCCGI